MIIAVLIVKNESHVLARCLQSVVPYVDGVCVYDTGSTENEAAKMRSILHVLSNLHKIDPTYYVMGNWTGFAGSRNAAMSAAEDRYQLDAHDWLFMIDADDYVTKWEEPPQTRHLGHTVNMLSGNISYPRTQLFRPGNWIYRGVVHEFAELINSQIPGTTERVGTLSTTVVSTREGARNQDPNKYTADAALLLDAIRSDKDPDLKPRYMFYLAQSYRDAGEDALASEWYAGRAALNEGYQEERYVSYLNLLRLKYKELSEEKDTFYDMAEMVTRAQEICPHRREATWQLMRYFREFKCWKDVVTMFEAYPVSDVVPTGLFIEQVPHTFGMYDEAGIAYYYLDQLDKSLTASVCALARMPDLPLTAKRVVDNAVWALP